MKYIIDILKLYFLLAVMFFLNDACLVGQVRMDSIQVGTNGQISFVSSTKKTVTTVPDSFWNKLSATIIKVFELPSIGLPTGNMVLRGEGFKEEKKEITPAQGNLLIILGVEIINKGTQAIPISKDNFKIIGRANTSNPAIYLEQHLTGGFARQASTYEIKPTLAESIPTIDNENFLNNPKKYTTRESYYLIFEVAQKDLASLNMQIGSHNIGNLNQFSAWNEFIASKKIITSNANETLTTLECQNFLKQHGYDPGIVDGKWGKKTEAALKQFQKANNLIESGKLDLQTNTKILELKNNKK